jgi:CheY-like chemotaxis protein
MPSEDAKVVPLDPGPLVLVVDDELTHCSIVRSMVGTLGYPARSCLTGQEALRFLKAHLRAVRFLLTDLAMPKMDGGELAERALDVDPSLHVVLMAGLGDAQALELLAGYRDLPLLVKPVNLGALQEHLEAHLGAPPRTPSYLPVPPPRERTRRRTSGHHEV